jgi:hypothetical protein
MKILKKLGMIFLLGFVIFVGAETGEQLAVPGIHSMIPEAQAIVGRPLTPVSYAGVARRTVRRCAAGVYYC